MGKLMINQNKLRPAVIQYIVDLSFSQSYAAKGLLIGVVNARKYSLLDGCYDSSSSENAVMCVLGENQLRQVQDA